MVWKDRETCLPRHYSRVSMSVRQYVSMSVCQYVSTSVCQYVVWLQYVSTLVRQYAMLPKLYKPQQGELAPLSNAPLGIKRLPTITPSVAHHFCHVPEMLLEAQHHLSNSIGCQNIKCLLPIKCIICLLQTYIDLIERALITPGQALSKLCLDCGCPCSTSRKSAMESIMELDQC